MARYVGLDVHKHLIVSCIIDEDSNIIERSSYTCSKSSIESFCKKHYSKDDKVALEATTNCWSVSEIIEPYVNKVIVSNPLKTKAIAESAIKTDKVDALTLAQLLRVNFLPEVWHPSSNDQLLRQLSVYYSCLINDRTRVKNRLQSLFHRRLIKVPVVRLFSNKGLNWLKSVELNVNDRMLVDSAIEQVLFLNNKLAEIEKKIAILGNDNFGVKLLMTIPGISFMTAVCIIGALGDIDRFIDGDHLASYFGLVPRVKQSASHCYYGRITKRGNNQVRRMLVLSARNLRENDGPLGTFYRKISQRKNCNVAAVATARKIITIVYHMLKNGEPYRYSSPKSADYKFGSLHMLVYGEKRTPVKIKRGHNEVPIPKGYRKNRFKPINDVLSREGLLIINLNSVPIGEKVVINNFKDYIEEINSTKVTYTRKRKA